MAFRDFVVKTHIPARLVIAGAYTDSKALAEMVHEQGLDEFRDFRGVVDKQGVRDILYESDCLVLASRSEAQPLVLFEAMSTGIPVISTEVTPRSQRIEGCHIVPRTMQVHCAKRWNGRAATMRRSTDCLFPMLCERTSLPRQ